MTKEAMIKVLRYKAEHIKTKIKPEFFTEVADVLEQQPCEDATDTNVGSKMQANPCSDTISRADAVRVASGYCHPSNIAKELAKLPPAQPKIKTGHWIYDKRIENWKCSECGYTTKMIGYVGCAEFMAKHFKFCNHCGVRMVEPQAE